MTDMPPLRPAMIEPMDLVLMMATAPTKAAYRAAEREYRRLTGEVKPSARELWATHHDTPNQSAREGE